MNRRPGFKNKSTSSMVLHMILLFILIQRIQSDTGSITQQQCPARCDMLKEIDVLRGEMQILRQLLNQESLLRMNLDQNIQSQMSRMIDNFESKIQTVNQTLLDQTVEVKNDLLQEFDNVGKKVILADQTTVNLTDAIHDEREHRMREIKELEMGLIEVRQLTQRLNQSNYNPGTYIAFSASGAKNFSGKIVFANVTVNLGNAYTSSTGIFRAPATGVYVFMWTVATDDKKNCDTELTVNNKIFHKNMVQSGGINEDNAGSQTTIIRLSTNDNVYIRPNTQFYDCSKIHYEWSTFLGFRYDI